MTESLSSLCGRLLRGSANAPSSNERRTSKCSAYQKSDHNLVIANLKGIWNKCIKNEKMKTTSSSGIFKTIYHIGCTILLFGKIKLQSLKVYCV